VTQVIAIGTVIYHPTEKLVLRLLAAVSAGYCVYVFDNSPDHAMIRNLCHDMQNDRIKYLTCGKNVGLGYALSSICAQAYYDSFPALLFFDQDTVFDRSTLAFVAEFYSHNSCDLGSYSAIVFNSTQFGATGFVGKYAFNDVVLAINSGSLYLLDNVRKIKWHNESFFVDCVDFEFCLRSSNSNMRIGECANAPGYNHEIEQGSIQYLFFGKELRARAYPFGRLVDSARAGLRLLITSIYAGNMRCTGAIGTSMMKFFVVQLLVRVLNPQDRRRDCDEV